MVCVTIFVTVRGLLGDATAVVPMSGQILYFSPVCVSFR